MKELPLVSVFLPTYNQQEFIADSIDSVLNQDYENLEIVIGDDCSTDNTWQIVQEYQRKFPEKIKAFRNHKNLGITGNCNEVLKRCTGKYVVYTAGDDLFLPGKISAQVAVMEKDPNVVLCYHDIEVFQSSNNTTLRYWNHGPSSSKPITGPAIKVAEKLIENGTAFMAALSVMARRCAIPLTGYDVRVPVASDWLMWIEISANGGPESKVQFINRVLARYRMHGANATSYGYKHTADELVTLSIVEDKYPTFVRSVDRGHAYIRYRNGVRMISNGEIKVGRKLLLLSLCSRWITWKIFYWLAVSYFPTLLQFRQRK